MPYTTLFPSLGRLPPEGQHAARQEVLASDLHDAGTEPVPLLQRLRGAALGYSKWLVALDQVAHKEAAPGHDLADCVAAQQRRSKGTQVVFGRAALVPTRSEERWFGKMWVSKSRHWWSQS